MVTFDADLARTLAANTAYPDEGHRWEPFITALIIRPPTEPVWFTSEIRALIGDPWPDRARWRAHANCLGVDPELFFPERGQTAQIQTAKRVCAGCTVRTQCLTDALNQGEHHGVFGGTSEKERRRIRKKAAA